MGKGPDIDPLARKHGRPKGKAYKYEVGIATRCWCYLCGEDHPWRQPCAATLAAFEGKL